MTRWRPSIGQRLFIAVLLSFLAVGALGLALVRWHLADGVPVAAPLGETRALDALAADLQAQYGRRSDWSFLPPAAGPRSDWLRAGFQRALTQVQSAEASGPAVSATLGDRLGLVDNGGHTLAGRVPGRLLVAAASIDTRVRTLSVDGQAIGRLVESRSDNPDDALAVAFLLDQQRNLAAVAVAGALLSALLAAGLAAHFGRPIRQLVAGAQALESGRFETRLPALRGDELGRLAQAFNHLAARLQATEQARTQWVADTSHELRTPLAVMQGQIEALQDGLRAATPGQLSLMLRQVQALTRLVDDLDVLAQAEIGAPSHHLQPVDIWPLVQDVARAFADRAQNAGLQIDLGPPPARAVVAGDVQRLRQVLSNLLENSVRYTDPGGRIEIRARNQDDGLHLSLADSAPGVPAASLARLSERFYRVEPSRSRASGGSGLGLALCRRIVERHHGRIAFTAASLGGLQVDIVLPLREH